jgi:hypothetical protein
VDELNCLRRTTVFGAESTTVNTTRQARTDQMPATVEEYKENCKAVLAIQEEVVCLEKVDSRVLATPSRVRQSRDAPMSVTRTPGQRKSKRLLPNWNDRLTLFGQRERHRLEKLSSRPMKTWKQQSGSHPSLPVRRRQIPHHQRNPERDSRRCSIHRRQPSTRSDCSLLRTRRHRD